MNIWLKRPLAYVVAFLLGASLTLAFAPYSVSPLAIVAPAGLLALWLYATPKQAGWSGFWFGLGFFSTGVYWIFISIHNYGDVPTIVAGLITVSLFIYLALFFAFAGYFYKRLFPYPTSNNIIFAFPALWILTTEWFRTLLLGGFPWLLLGYSQIDSPLKGFAPIFGVYGVTLATLLTSALIVNSYQQYKQKNYGEIYSSVFTLLTIWILGSLLNLMTWTYPAGKSLKVSLVQGNIPQSLKWDPNNLQLSLDRYSKLTKPLWGKSDLIIWPEASVPITMQNAEQFINALDVKAQETHTQLMLGIPVESLDGKEYYNGIIMLGKERGLYFKRLLVPFGEFVPFQKLLAGVFDILHVPMSNLSPAPYAQLPIQLGHIKILSSICFEITFPDLMRSLDQSIGLLLTVTNDAWFNKSIAQAQHLQMAQMRAAEFHRPVLFSSNDGITAVIDRNGMIIDALPDHTTSVLTTNVQPMIGITPWMLFGSESVMFTLVSMLFFAWRQQREARKASNLTTNETNTTQGLINP